MQMCSNCLMVIHANSADMSLHIYFNIIYQTVGWLKAREMRTVGKRSGGRSSKAKWPDAVSVSISTAVTGSEEEKFQEKGLEGRQGEGEVHLVTQVMQREVSCF